MNIARELLKVAMDVTLGEAGLSKTWQAQFPPKTLCLRCGGDARIAFVVLGAYDVNLIVGFPQE